MSTEAIAPWQQGYINAGLTPPKPIKDQHEIHDQARAKYAEAMVEQVKSGQRLPSHSLAIAAQIVGITIEQVKEDLGACFFLIQESGTLSAEPSSKLAKDVSAATSAEAKAQAALDEAMRKTIAPLQATLTTAGESLKTAKRKLESHTSDVQWYADRARRWPEHVVLAALNVKAPE